MRNLLRKTRNVKSVMLGFMNKTPKIEDLVICENGAKKNKTIKNEILVTKKQLAIYEQNCSAVKTLISWH